MGSIAGFLAMPAEGFYSATKHALELCRCIANGGGSLRRPAALVEPGFVRTNFASKARAVGAPLAVYDEMRRALGQGLAHDVETGLDPTEVAACVSRIVASEAPKLRHLAGREAGRLRRLKSLLPARMFEWGLRRRFGLVKAP